MPTFVRVEDKETGAQYDVDSTAFRKEIHTRLNDREQWPDVTGDGARPRPAVIRTTKAGAPAPKKES